MKQKISIISGFLFISDFQFSSITCLVYCMCVGVCVLFIKLYQIYTYFRCWIKSFLFYIFSFCFLFAFFFFGRVLYTTCIHVYIFKYFHFYVCFLVFFSVILLRCSLQTYVCDCQLCEYLQFMFKCLFVLYCMHVCVRVRVCGDYFVVCIGICYFFLFYSQQAFSYFFFTFMYFLVGFLATFYFIEVYVFFLVLY